MAALLSAAMDQWDDYLLDQEQGIDLSHERRVLILSKVISCLLMTHPWSSLRQGYGGYVYFSSATLGYCFRYMSQSYKLTHVREDCLLLLASTSIC